MSAEVIGLHGAEAVNPKTFDPAVAGAIVEDLERLIVMAKSGQVTGIAYVLHTPRPLGEQHWGRCGFFTRSMVGWLFALMHDLTIELDEGASA